jgi:hypothetical protein
MLSWEYRVERDFIMLPLFPFRRRVEFGLLSDAELETTNSRICSIIILECKWFVALRGVKVT